VTLPINAPSTGLTESIAGPFENHFCPVEHPVFVSASPKALSVSFMYL
jgi:hypothetical protein